MSVQLTTLGAVRVFRGETELPELPAQRLRLALLVYLALERDVSRESVLAMFWPERDNGRGKHALRQMLYELRQALGEDWVELRRDRIVASVSVDALEFEAAAGEGRVEDALRAYGGPFLLGFSLDNRSFEAWVERRRAHIGRTFRRLQRDHIARLIAADDPDGALVAARRWVELDPLEDEAAHTLIERLAASGERADALQYYETYEQQLAAELEVEPLDETKALVAAIRAGDAVPQDIIRPHRDPVEQASAGGPAAAGDARPYVPSVPARAARWSQSRLLRRGLVAAAVIAAISVGVFFARPRPGIPLVADRQVTLAVLPLDDRTPGQSLKQLALELTETLAQSLARSPLFDVISPKGVQFLNEVAAEDSLREVPQYDFVVGGSVSSDERGIRLVVEVLNGRSGSIVHSEVVERPPEESRILVEDVVQQAATILRREIGAEVEIARVRARTGNEEAWQHFLDARESLEAAVLALGAGDFATFDKEQVRSDTLLATAARLDRRWAEPMALRGRMIEKRVSLLHALTPNDTMATRDLLERALWCAEEAMRRDPRYAEGWALRGSVRHQLARLAHDSREQRSLQQMAEADLVRATELDELHQGAWGQLAELLLNRNDYRAAKSAAQRAYRLDPVAPQVPTLINHLFVSSFELGEDEEAESWCLLGRIQSPEAPPFLYCLMALHAWADSIPPQPAVLRRAMERYGVAQLGRVQPELPARLETMIAAAFARAAAPDSARAILRRHTDGSDPGLLWLRASVHVQLGEDSAAVALLQQYADRDPAAAAAIARRRPFWRLAHDPGFDRLIAAAR
ncbi:MAG TPA: BTAD domain-containing putative transcriptional regulator [Longimicrobiales bacterium]